eukprot:1130458-Prymnesium_polylepis.1
MAACDLAAEGNIAGLAALPPSSLHEFDPYGSQPIHWAASCGRLKALEWLVAAGADPESQGLINKRAKRRRPLHWAARNGQLSVVKFLVGRVGVDADPRDKQSVSPFQLAVWQNWLDVARFLVDEAGVVSSGDFGAAAHT